MSRAIGYVVPMVTFLSFTTLESYFTGSWFAALYVVKVCAVTAVLLAFKAPLRDIRVARNVVWSSVAVGLGVCVLWVVVDKVVPYPHVGTRSAFDPFALGTPFGIVGFLAARFYGLVLMVPVMEELLWRSFLLRYLTDVDFEAVPLTGFSPFALWGMVISSALVHPEWLVAALASLIYALWLRRTASLFSTVVAHATTNAALGIYVIAARDWQYW